MLSRQLTRPTLGGQDRELLAGLYSEEVSALGELLGRDLDGWLETPEDIPEDTVAGGPTQC
jgi:hypothetical protein